MHRKCAVHNNTQTVAPSVLLGGSGMGKKGKRQEEGRKREHLFVLDSLPLDALPFPHLLPPDSSLGQQPSWPLQECRPMTRTTAMTFLPDPLHLHLPPSIDLYSEPHSTEVVSRKLQSNSPQVSCVAIRPFRGVNSLNNRCKHHGNHGRFSCTHQFVFFTFPVVCMNPSINKMLRSPPLPTLACSKPIPSLFVTNAYCGHGPPHR
jgi:hypothetical protein